MFKGPICKKDYFSQILTLWDSRLGIQPSQKHQYLISYKLDL